MLKLTQNQLTTKELMTNDRRHIYLDWLNPFNKSRIPAGIAFYNEKYGDLKIVLNHEHNNTD